MTTSQKNAVAHIVEGIMLGDEGVLTLLEVSRASAVHADFVVELVEEGVIHPSGQEPTQWRFSSVCLIKVRKAVRLKNDLGLNLAGVALALQLLEELEEVNARLRRIADAKE